MRLYHNPRCSKSRQAVAILSESGVVFEEYRYLELGIAEEDLGNFGFSGRDNKKK